MFEVSLPMKDICEEDDMISIFRGTNMNGGASLLIEDSELNRRINKVTKEYGSPINKIKSSQKQIKGLYNKVNKRITDVINESGLTTNALEFEKEGFKTLSSLISTEISAIDKEEKFINDKQKAILAERKQYYGEKVVVAGNGGSIGNGVPTSAANYASIMDRQGSVVGGQGSGSVAMDSNLLNGGHNATNVLPAGMMAPTIKDENNKDSTGGKNKKEGGSSNFSEVADVNSGIIATEETIEYVPGDDEVVGTTDDLKVGAEIQINDGMIGNLEENFDTEGDLSFGYAATCLNLRNKNVEPVIMYDPNDGKYWGATKDRDTGELIEGYTEHINLIKPATVNIDMGMCTNVQGGNMKLVVASSSDMPEMYKEQWATNDSDDEV